jgi:hypothetical protein
MRDKKANVDGLPDSCYVDMPCYDVESYDDKVLKELKLIRKLLEKLNGRRNKSR